MFRAVHGLHDLVAALMYGKVFAQIFDGTLHGHLEATAVFMAMIAIADQDGVVNLTFTALTSRTGWPAEFVRKGIEHLEQADPESRTPDEDGRRIVRLRDNTSWGWRITNYAKYREIRDENSRRKYMREYMRNRRRKPDVNSVNSGKPQLAKAEVEAEADISLPSGERAEQVPPPAQEVGKGEGKPKSKRRSGLGHFVPDDFRVSEDDYRDMLERGYSRAHLETETERFCDHEFDRPKSDWTRAWRNWITRNSPNSGDRYAPKKRTA